MTKICFSSSSPGARPWEPRWACGEVKRPRGDINRCFKHGVVVHEDWAEEIRRGHELGTFVPARRLAKARLWDKRWPFYSILSAFSCLEGVKPC